MGASHLKALVLDWRENGSNCHVSGIRQHVNSCDVIYVIVFQTEILENIVY